MTKSELIESVANKLKLPKGKAELIVNCVFDSMEAALKNGERIEIRGFGSFEIRHYKAYEGRNPRTGTKVEVRPKRLPFFKVGKELKERVNNGRLTDDSEPASTEPAAAATVPESIEPPVSSEPMASPASEATTSDSGVSSTETPLRPATDSTDPPY